MTHPGEEIRKALGGRSQGWLAQQIGIRRASSICLILSGRRRLTPRMARRVAKALDLDASDLMAMQMREEAETA